jgi:PAS domain S-box-containing protein
MAPWSAVIVTDVSGRVIGWSHGAQRLYGWTSEEAVGQPIVEMMIPPDHSAEAALIIEGLAEPTSSGWEGPFPVKRKDGTVLSVYAHDRPIIVDGKVVAIYGESAPVLPSKAGVIETEEPGAVEPLTQREQDVLRLLPTYLGVADMAALLYVSTNTLKTHLKAIYRKLGVNSRREAIDRAASTRVLSDEPAD